MNQNLDQCFSKTDQQTFMAAPYLTGTDGVLFSMVSPADDLQLLIQNGINKWFTQRCAIEFPEPRPAQMATATATAAAAPTDQPNPQFPRVIQRWMSHILLTTTINIATANANPDRHGTTAWVAPLDHFINNMMLHCGRFSDLLVSHVMFLACQITANTHTSLKFRRLPSTMRSINKPQQH